MKRLSVIHLAVIAALVTLALLGCRKFPDEPSNNAPIAVQGTYVGVGNLGGGATNVSLGLVGPDSSGRYGGEIGYRGQIVPLQVITRDSTGDTLRFQYVRDGAMNRAWALLSATGLTVHFAEPSGINEFRLNREAGGYNMSGIWQGYLYSNLLHQQRTATMTMEQQGAGFSGTLDVNLMQSATLTLQSGISNVSSFQLSGTMRYAGADYPVTMYGNYVNADSLSGNWQAGTNGDVDSGPLAFKRSFQ